MSLKISIFKWDFSESDLNFYKSFWAKLRPHSWLAHEPERLENDRCCAKVSGNIAKWSMLAPGSPFTSSQGQLKGQFKGVLWLLSNKSGYFLKHRPLLTISISFPAKYRVLEEVVLDKSLGIHFTDFCWPTLRFQGDHIEMTRTLIRVIHFKVHFPVIWID